MEHCPAQILILARTSDTACGWAEALRSPETRVWLAPCELPDGVSVDLIVTDLPGAGSESAAPNEVGTDQPAVIAVGCQRPADLCLPADVTPRELRLACCLLAEIVRLRRVLRLRADSQQRLLAEAMTDPLTGLPNRRAWDRMVAELLGDPRVGQAASLPHASSSRDHDLETGSALWQPAPRPETGWQPILREASWQLALRQGPGSSLCLAILDLDLFKRVNDQCGYTAGDQVLCSAAQAIAGNLRHGDFVARLGGDEFGLLLTLHDEPAAISVIDRVRQAIPRALAQARLPAITASAGVCLTASVGSQARPVQADALLSTADAALRRAKQEGRDRLVVASAAVGSQHFFAPRQ